MCLWMSLSATAFLPACGCSSSRGVRTIRDSAAIADGRADDATVFDASAGPEERPKGPTDVAIDEAVSARPDSRDGAVTADSGSSLEVPGVVAGSAFRSAKVSRRFFLCPATLDCESFIELSGDGTLRVDRENDLSHTISSAQLSDADREAALAVLTDPDLFSLLQAPPGCPFIPDTAVEMWLEIGDVTVVASIAQCTQAPIVAADEMMRTLQKRYLP
jgi:hypothetical protein